MTEEFVRDGLRKDADTALKSVTSGDAAKYETVYRRRRRDQIYIAVLATLLKGARPWAKDWAKDMPVIVDRAIAAAAHAERALDALHLAAENPLPPKGGDNAG